MLYAIVDHVVDDYEPVVRGLENDINEVEREVFSRSGGSNPVERVYQLKRTVLELHDSLEPLLEPLRQLAVDRFKLVEDDMQEYFRDVADHLARLVDRVTQFRELLTSILAANLTQVGIQQNEDMRKISAWVAIAAVPTAIAGIYGMNFDSMPELRLGPGLPAHPALHVRDLHVPVPPVQEVGLALAVQPDGRSARPVERAHRRAGADAQLVEAALRHLQGHEVGRIGAYRGRAGRRRRPGTGPCRCWRRTSRRRR